MNRPHLHSENRHGPLFVWMNSEWSHREHKVLSLGSDVNGLSIRMAPSLRKTPTWGVPRRASSFFRDSGCTHSRRAETDQPMGAVELFRDRCDKEAAMGMVPFHISMSLDGFITGPERARR